jgi:hypothetical protein
MPDSRDVILTERAMSQRDANVHTEDAGSSLSSSEASYGGPASGADHESNAALLQRIISMLAERAPTRAPIPVRDRQQPPAKRVRTSTWDRRPRSPSPYRNAGYHNRQGQKEAPASRRFNKCFRCGTIHFPYCKKNQESWNRNHSPIRGRSCNRSDRGKSAY